jgi:carboxyl-terminal processing protease
MKKLLLSITLLLFGSFALASPAQDLWDEFKFYMKYWYYGYEGERLAKLIPDYDQKLQRLCASSCDFATTQSLLNSFVDELGDSHTDFYDSKSLGNLQAGFANINTNPVPIFGLSLRGSNSQSQVRIATVLAGSSAEAAGLQPNDRIAQVNGKKPSSLSDLNNFLGQSQQVELTIHRGDVSKPEIFNATLQKSLVPNPSLPILYQLSNTNAVFVLRIPSFIGVYSIGPRVHELVKLAQSKKASAIIVDLRSNGGGEESEANIATGAFLARFSYLSQTRYLRIASGYDNGTFYGNDPRDPKTYSLASPALWTGKMTVLVNSSSASGAEYMAYALQKNQRALVIGEKTAGSLNTFTEAFPLIDGSGLLLTYGRSLNNDGSAFPERLTPDILLPDDANAAALTGRDPMIEKALEVLARQ